MDWTFNQSITVESIMSILNRTIVSKHLPLSQGQINHRGLSVTYHVPAAATAQPWFVSNRVLPTGRCPHQTQGQINSL
jgi:hypothetical protein